MGIENEINNDEIINANEEVNEIITEDVEETSVVFSPYLNYAILKPDTRIYIPAIVKEVGISSEHLNPQYKVVIDHPDELSITGFESKDLIVNPLDLFSDDDLEQELARRKFKNTNYV